MIGSMVVVVVGHTTAEAAEEVRANSTVEVEEGVCRD